MKKQYDITKKALNLIKLYPLSLLGGMKNRKLFDDIETYCMFLGYSRSGHSIIAALLDAHPNIIIAHELGALHYIYTRFSKRQIYYLLLKRSRLYAERGRKRGGYCYEVPNQWQGRYKKLKIIGDKQGEGAVMRLRVIKGLLERLLGTMENNIKFIHVTRNPYDNISTMHKYAKILDNNATLNGSINFYFSLCETVVGIKREINTSDIFELRHESFIMKPKKYLSELCKFLGVDSPVDYLNDCADIVFSSPHKSRYKIKWNEELINLVKNRMTEYPFLSGYCYEE